MMSKKLLSLVVLLLPLLAFAAVPAARAACDDAPVPGVVWDGCSKNGENFNGEDLSNGILTNGSFIGTTFVDATLDGISFANSDLTNADIGSSPTAVSDVDVDPTGTDGVITVINLQGATIQGLKMGGQIITSADMTGAKGIPDLNNIIFLAGTCPNGDPTGGVDPWCTWEPLAVSLTGVSAAAVPSGLPLALTALMLAVTAVVIVTKNRN